MKTLTLLFLFTFNLHAAEFCESEFSVSNEISDISNPLLFQFSSKYYLYYESKNLEDLQVLKNCLDYSACGKNQESLVLDPKNYRMHIYTSLKLSELENIVRSCPIANIASKLVVKENSQSGRPVSLSYLKPSLFGQTALIRSSSPALFHRPSEKESKAVLAKLAVLLKAKKTVEAEKLVIRTWGINLHDYKIEYGEVGDGFATTTHKDKMIRYGKDWLDNPCGFARMIRHEAEHVAQVRRSHACKRNHNLSDHKMRERAAHLNDARFAQGICPELPERKYCLDRFEALYLNNKK